MRAGDRIPKRSIAVRIEQLQQSGSDLVTGAPRQIRGNSRIFPPADAIRFQDVLVATSLTQMPALLTDDVLGSKLFTRPLWDQVNAVLAGIRASRPAQIAIIGLHLANRFDLLSEHVYSIRDDGSASDRIDRSCETGTLTDALTNAREDFDLLKTLGVSKESCDAWAQRLMDSDLEQFYSVIARVDGDYFHTLSKALEHWSCLLNDAVWDEVRLHNRVLIELIADGHRQAAERVSLHRNEEGSSYAKTIIDDRIYGSPGYLALIDPPVTEETLRCRKIDLPVISKLRALHWDGTRVILEGHAYVAGIDPYVHDHALELSVVRSTDGLVMPMTIKAQHDPTIDWGSPDAWVSHASQAFRAFCDVADAFKSAVDPAEEATWTVRIRLRVAGHEFNNGIESREKHGALESLELPEVLGDRRAIPTFRPIKGLSMQVSPEGRVLRSIRVDGRMCYLTVDPVVGTGHRFVVRPNDGPDLPFERPTGHAGEAVHLQVLLPPLPVSAAKRKQFTFDLVAIDHAGREAPLLWGSSSQDFVETIDQSGALRPSLTQDGRVVLRERLWRCEATAVDLADDGNTLTVCGTFDLEDTGTPTFEMSTRKSLIGGRIVSVEHRAGTTACDFTATFSLIQPAWGENDVTVEPGDYSLSCIPAGRDRIHGTPVRAGRRLLTALPRHILDDRLHAIVRGGGRAGELRIEIGPPRRADEIGRFNRRLLKERISDLNKAAHLVDAVVFQCFSGRRTTDMPRRLLEELQSRGTSSALYWAITDYSVPRPEGTLPLVVGSRKYIEVLHTASTLVNNNMFPTYFRKTPGQTYIQTWHGTPLKRLGQDVSRNRFSLSYWSLLEREASYWDCLVVQNDYAADVLARAFRFTGKVVNRGYPRNDSLADATGPEIRRRTRERLGIGEDETAILYAPTWRDNTKTAAGYAMTAYLDFGEASAELPSTSKLMFRGHHNIAALRETSDNEFMLDVTEYPEVNDLYLASDMLITDYSSVMFDYCVTGKPIFYLAPDMHEYGSTIRGFYFDLPSCAPGPILDDTTQVVAAIKNVARLREQYAERYRSFVSRFAPYDDGRATKRVFQEAWPQLTKDVTDD